MSRSTRSIDDQIEFLTPNDAAFGGDGGADFVGFDQADDPVFGDEGPRSRWLPAVAAMVVLGLFGAGVIAAAPWDDQANATPPTTTPTTVAAPTTTLPPSPTTQPAFDATVTGPPGFLLNDPGQLHITAAWSIGAGARPDSAYADDRFDLWTTPDAARTSGRWLAVSIQHSRGSYEEMFPNAVRLMVGDTTAVLGTDADGVNRLSFVALDGTPFVIGGFGLTLDELLAVATEVRAGADDRTIIYGTLIDGVLAGMSEVVSLLVPFGGIGAYILLGSPQSGASYTSADGRASLEVRRSEPNDTDGIAFRFLMRPVTELSAQDLAVLTMLCVDHDCRGPVRISAHPDFPDSLLVSWIDERGAIAVASYGVQLSTVIAALPQVRLSDEVEWADLVLQTNTGTLEGVDLPYPQPSAPTAIGQYEFGSDAPYWTAQMTADGPITLNVSTDNTGWGGVLNDVGVTPTVHRYASPSIAFVVGTAQFPSTARTMRVTVQGLPPVDVPMVQVVDTTTFAAAYAYPELLPDTVEFLDVSGAVVTG